jgi:uncharacterized membrane protein HdeD (DUF308 family)
VTQTAQEPAEMVGRLGRHWGWLLAYGVIEICTALSHREMPQRGWTVAMGAPSMA